MKTAILVDGGFYRKRANTCLGAKAPKDRADELFEYCLRHLDSKQGERYLYRIFYYDCPPMSKKVYHPLLKRTVDFSKTDQFIWMYEFLQALTFKRKLALRLGELNVEQAHFSLKRNVFRDLFGGKRTFESLQEEDFAVNVKIESL